MSANKIKNECNKIPEVSFLVSKACQSYFTKSFTISRKNFDTLGDIFV
jgi:hypothetical protein